MMRNFSLYLVLSFAVGSYAAGQAPRPGLGPSEYPPGIVASETVPTGKVFYVDPLNGDMANDGSADRPWKTLQEVIEKKLIRTRDFQTKPFKENGPMVEKNPGAPVRSGDTLMLRSGYHGKVDISGAYNAEYITIMAERGHSPQVSGINMRSAEKWRFMGLSISPQYGSPPASRVLINIESHKNHGPARNIVVEDCYGFSIEDSSTWSLLDWNSLSCNGITAKGDNITIRANRFKNVNFGISVTGNFALVKGNTVENFCGDGMRGIGSDMFFEYNVVKNCYDVNDNHHDGFQSWSFIDKGDTPRERIVLRGNTIINNVDPNQPFKGTLQGIGCFDGPYVDWVIENNLIVINDFHGISLYGAQNCRVVNNTVVDLSPGKPGPPWIMITDHKKGTPSAGCLIRNNIAPLVKAGKGVSEDHNIQLPEGAYSRFFVAPESFNYRPRPGSPAVDAGNDEEAPSLDREMRKRIQGRSVDAGAYESD